MSNWEIVKINDIGKVVTGKTPRTDDSQNYGSDFMFLGPTDLHKHFIITESEKMISSKGLASIKGSKLDGLSILVGCIGWDMGNVALVNCKCATNQQINSITEIKESYNPLYIYYWLKHKKNYLFQIANVTRTPILNKSDFSNIELSVPNKIEQDKIAKFLSDLDAKIEINNRINTELEAMAKTLYDYWFVQFDFPYVTSSGVEKPYKTSGGKMVWNEELKRDIPDSWEVKKVKDIAETGSGGTPLKSKKEYFENGTIPWINSGEVNASFIISSRKFISQKGLDNSSAKLFQRGTILMAMYGATAGQVSLIDLEASTNQAVCGIIPNDKRMIPYLKYGLHQLYDYLINLSSGSARDNLSQDKIKELYFVIPEDKLIAKFYKISNSHFEMILRNLKENQELASLRDWLLPMLMNGQVSVCDVAEEFGMVAEESVRYGK